MFLSVLSVVNEALELCFSFRRTVWVLWWGEFTCSTLCPRHFCSEQEDLFYQMSLDSLLTIQSCFCFLFWHPLNASPAAGKNETDNPMPCCDLHTPAVFWCCSVYSDEWKEAYLDLPCLWQKGSLREPNTRWVRDWLCRLHNYLKFFIMYLVVTFVTWGLAISYYFFLPKYFRLEEPLDSISFSSHNELCKFIS